MNSSVIAKVIEMRRNGATYKEISSALNLYPQQVYQILFKEGMVNKGGAKKKIGEEIEQQVIRMREEGETYMSISVKLNISSVSVYKLLKKNNLISN